MTDLPKNSPVFETIGDVIPSIADGARAAGLGGSKSTASMGDAVVAL